MSTGAGGAGRPEGYESTVSALSVTLVAMIAVTVILLARTPGMISTEPLFRVHPQIAQTDVSSPGEASHDPRMAEIRMRFQQAVVMLHAERYDDAVTALHRVIELSPRLPEAYVNMGYALFGLKRYQAAADFFRAAIELRPYQDNAYWGLAEALEALDDLPGALGAMRTYIHLAPPGDPYVRKARSALWEWDSRLARGPLPKNEADWIKRRTQQWEDRNSPDRDAPATGGMDIEVKDLE